MERLNSEMIEHMQRRSNIRRGDPAPVLNFGSLADMDVAVQLPFVALALRRVVDPASITHNIPAHVYEFMVTTQLYCSLLQEEVTAQAAMIKSLERDIKDLKSIHPKHYQY